MAIARIRNRLRQTFARGDNHASWRPILSAAKRRGLQVPGYLPRYMTRYNGRLEGNAMTRKEIESLAEVIEIPGPTTKKKWLTNAFHPADLVAAITAQPPGPKRNIVKKLIDEGRLTPEEIRDFSEGALSRRDNVSSEFARAVASGEIVDKHELDWRFMHDHGASPSREMMAERAKLRRPMPLAVVPKAMPPARLNDVKEIGLLRGPLPSKRWLT